MATVSNSSPSAVEPVRNQKSAGRLAPEIQSLLTSLRGGIRRYILGEWALAVLAILLGVFWIAAAIDFLPVKAGGTEMPRSARAAVLILTIMGILYVTYRLLLSRLWYRMPDESMALLLEKQNPRLAGRLITAVQLADQNRAGDVHSRNLLGRVQDEARQETDAVETGSVFRYAPLWQKACIVLPLLVALLVACMISPSSVGLAAQRLTLLTDAPWPRAASIEIVGVELPITSTLQSETDSFRTLLFESDGSIRLPLGSSGKLRIRAAATDSVVPERCTAYYETEDGDYGQTNLRRVGRIVDGYQSFVLDGAPLASLAGNVKLSVVGLDDRIDGIQITAVSAPAIASLDVATRYPDYLRDADADNDDDYQTPYAAGLRLREGSRVRLSATSSVPMPMMEVRITTDNGDWNNRDALREIGLLENTDDETFDENVPNDNAQNQDAQNQDTANASQTLAIQGVFAQSPPTLDFNADRTSVTVSIANLRSPATVLMVPYDADGLS
ncbi:MAG: hypothetical protein AAFP90_13375, partial [Planctomycetota bacterium]